MGEDFAILRVLLGLLEHSTRVLEENERVGEREEGGVVGGEGEEGAEGSAVLGRNGVGEGVQVLCDLSVCLFHAQFFKVDDPTKTLTDSIAKIFPGE